MDWWTKLEGEEACIQGRRMTTSPATCWNAGRFIGVIVRGRRMGQTVNETMLPRRRANKSQPWRCDIFPTGRVVSVLWD
jgi:hypothetical protein